MQILESKKNDIESHSLMVNFGLVNIDFQLASDLTQNSFLIIDNLAKVSAHTFKSIILMLERLRRENKDSEQIKIADEYSKNLPILMKQLIENHEEMLELIEALKGDNDATDKDNGTNSQRSDAKDGKKRQRG